jgi:hypothetical protein
MEPQEPWYQLPRNQSGDDAAEPIGTANVLAAASAATVEMMRFMVCSFRGVDFMPPSVGGGASRVVRGRDGRSVKYVT